MGDVYFRQELTVSAARLPAIEGDPVTQKDFEIIRESFDVSAYSEDSAGRFNIAENSPITVLSMGTVAKASVLVIRPEVDTLITLLNENGETQAIKFLANRTSIFHAEFTGLKIAPNTVAVKGKYFVLGD